jgi:hypothetical protein
MINSNTAMKIFADLFKIYFYYDAVTSIQLDDKKFNFSFENVPAN